MRERNHGAGGVRAPGPVLYRLLAALLFAVSAGILLYPTASAAWNGFVAKQRITTYEEAALEMDPDGLGRILEDARDYNAGHTVNVIADAFGGDEYELTHPYDKLLDPLGDGTMGYIEIPKIRQELVIYHGTGAYALENGVGHIEGTSLPIGGLGTHAALAGHRGLQRTRIFTDLDLLEEGDRFFLHILGDVLAYEVDDVRVVLPGELESLEICPGQDLVTLVTCTPYGVNTHRLLVRGRRVPYEEALAAEEAGKARPLDLMDVSLAALLCGIAAAAAIAVWSRIREKKKRKSK